MSLRQWTINAPKRTYSVCSPLYAYAYLQDSLEALEQLVQSQKAALERVQGDIDRLKQLRSDAQQQPSLDFTSLQAKVCMSFHVLH